MQDSKQLDLFENYLEDIPINLNELETPNDVYNKISYTNRLLGIPEPDLDICASEHNRKCYWFISKEQDCLKTEFLIPARITNTIWCNSAHNIYEKVLPRIFRQYEKYQFNATILIPSNNEGMKYWNELVEPNRIEVNPNGFCFYYPYKGVIYFEINGKRLISEKTGKEVFARNRYKVLILVKKSKVDEFKKNLIRLSNT